MIALLKCSNVKKWMVTKHQLGVSGWLSKSWPLSFYFEHKFLLTSPTYKIRPVVAAAVELDKPMYGFWRDVLCSPCGWFAHTKENLLGARGFNRNFRGRLLHGMNTENEDLWKHCLSSRVVRTTITRQGEEMSSNKVKTASWATHRQIQYK